MKTLREHIVEGLKISTNTKVNTYKYHPKETDELEELVNKLIDERGNDAGLNDIDVSEITDMSYMFYNSKFNGDISKWDVSNVTKMYSMFYNSEFTGENGDISEWNVNNVEDMSNMFDDCPLENNPPKWYKK